MLRRIPRGLVHTAVVLLGALWLSSLVGVLVLTYAPPEEPGHAWGYWSTWVVLLATLPPLLALARWAFADLRRTGPRGEPDEDEQDAPRTHRGLSGRDEPPSRW